MSKKKKLEYQEINSSESENDNSLEENTSVFNRTESEVDFSTENLQEVGPNLTSTTTSTAISTATSMATSITTPHESSWVWKFFSKEYDDQNQIKSLICSLCKTRYKATNSPGTLATHLRTKHKEKAEYVQATLDKFKSKPYSKQDQRYKELTGSIIDFIVCCQLPFAIVDNPYFVKMLNLFDNRY
ncbi:34147_t:CDS:1 [Racocetra persica]|uniref:34147_t:CDS:1 n=1 Tax=Racocetra persica TaxID=160502 RepID=A0ACA9MJQ9_9GLOM|nr:34147_t:CDS:1 [Racocetra persica]